MNTLGNVLRNLLLRYIPLLAIVVIAAGVFGHSSSLTVALIFILAQIFIIEVLNFLPDSSPLAGLQIDLAPLAGVFIAYYFSFWPAVIAMLIILFIVDIDRNINVFAELDDVMFNFIIVGLAILFRSAEFFGLAMLLIFLRFFFFTLVHGYLFREFNPKKYLNEGVPALIIVGILRILQLAFG